MKKEEETIMKRMKLMAIPLVLTMALAGCSNAASSNETTTVQETTITETTTAPETSAPEPETTTAENVAGNELTPETEQLAVGTVSVYDFDDVKLHVYATNDALGDYSFLLETADSLIGIEAPAFDDNLTEYVEYIGELGKPLSDIFVSSHPNGADTELYANATIHGTQAVINAINEGGSVKGLVDGFVETFGEGFNANLATVTDVLEAGTVTAGGLEFVIIENGDGYDIEIPAINSVYTHMMGSDVHNILSSVEHIDAMIAQFEAYQTGEVNFVLTSHYAPETLDDVAVKIAYLEQAKTFAQESTTAAEFVEKMQAEFSGYGGESYLEMSAGMLFPQS